MRTTDNQETPNRHIASNHLSVDGAAHYTIVVQGRLAEAWESYFDDMQVVIDAAGPYPSTTLSGQVADQAALYGLLQKLYMLGKPLISVSLNHF